MDREAMWKELFRQQGWLQGEHLVPPASGKRLHIQFSHGAGAQYVKLGAGGKKVESEGHFIVWGSEGPESGTWCLWADIYTVSF